MADCVVVLSMDLPPLAPGSHLLHIGPQKTGTTTMQAALHTSRAVLAEHGVHYAGKGSRPRRAGWAIGLGGQGSVDPVTSLQPWRRLVKEVQTSDARIVVVSNEDFGAADDDQARRVVTDLGGPQPHVLMVARRLDRILPSRWQQTVRYGEGRPYFEWLEEALSDDPHSKVRQGFMRQHDLGAALSRWAGLVGEENFTVVVADEGDRHLLPLTFERLLHLPHDVLRSAADEILAKPGQGNDSLGWSEAELIRQLHNAARAASWPEDRRRDVIRVGVAQAIRKLPPAERDRSRPGLPPWALARVRELSRQRHATLASSRVRVVGDLDNLILPEDTPTSDVADAPTTIATSTAVLGTLAALRAVGAPDGAAEEPTDDPVNSQFA